MNNPVDTTPPAYTSGHSLASLLDTGLVPVEAVDEIERLRSRLAEAEAQRDQMREAIMWALGERDEFPEAPELLAGKYKRRFYWRSELRRRAFGASDSAPAVGAKRYRLQDKFDPYRFTDFDAKIWNLIVVPADQPTSASGRHMTPAERQMVEAAFDRSCTVIDGGIDATSASDCSICGGSGWLRPDTTCPACNTPDQPTPTEP